MKGRSLAVLLAGSMVFSMAACSSGRDGGQTSGSGEVKTAEGSKDETAIQVFYRCKPEYSDDRACKYVQ